MGLEDYLVHSPGSLIEQVKQTNRGVLCKDKSAIQYSGNRPMRGELCKD